MVSYVIALYIYMWEQGVPGMPVVNWAFQVARTGRSWYADNTWGIDHSGILCASLHYLSIILLLYCFSEWGSYYLPPDNFHLMPYSMSTLIRPLQSAHWLLPPFTCPLTCYPFLPPSSGKEIKALIKKQTAEGSSSEEEEENLNTEENPPRSGVEPAVATAAAAVATPKPSSSSKSSSKGICTATRNPVNYEYVHCAFSGWFDDINAQHLSRLCAYNDGFWVWMCTFCW